MKSIIIAIISAPGVGKTYLAKKMVQKLNAILIDEPPINDRILENLKEQKRSFETIIYFLNKGIINIENAHRIKKKNKIVIMDTFWLSTFLHIETLFEGFEKELMKEQFKILEKYLLKPDIILHLKSSNEQIIKNVYSRGRCYDTNESYIKRIFKIKDEHDKYVKNVKNNNLKIIEIKKDEFDFALKDDLNFVIRKIEEILDKKQKEKLYFQNWIANINSQKDFPRIRYIESYLRNSMLTVKSDARILDIGCGWGELLKYIRPSQKYLGIDSNSYFLDYIKEKWKNKNFKLIHSNFPNIELSQKYDVIFCSMLLHYISDIRKAMFKIFECSHIESKIFILTFRDLAKTELKKSFSKITIETSGYIRGNFKLSSGIILKDITLYLHKEKIIEGMIRENNKNFNKKYLGDLFVAYEVS